MLVVDAHEDLAWNIQSFGRNYLLPLDETRARDLASGTVDRNGTSLLGWQEWIEGRVAIIFATLFVAPTCNTFVPSMGPSYAGAEEAHSMYWSQLEVYHDLARQHPDRFQLITDASDLDEVLATWEGDDPAARRIGLVLLMEGADAIREPREVERWYEGGIRMIGPAWTRTRYAGGTSDPGPFTEAGRALLKEMERLRIVLDLSHLSDEGALEALDAYPGPLMASHCNARALLLPGVTVPERHLSDEAIAGIAQRDGVIGVVLGNSFLRGGWTIEQGRAGITLADVAHQIDYMCQLIGDARHVGIGSDFDGGIGLEKVPEDIRSVADLPRLGEALDKLGYSVQQIEDILGRNWLSFLRRVL